MQQALTLTCVGVSVSWIMSIMSPYSLATHIFPPLTRFRPMRSLRQEHHLPSSLQSLHPTALYHSQEECLRARVGGPLSLSLALPIETLLPEAEE